MRNNNYIILLLAFIKFALPFLLQNTAYELHRDEFLYYQQGLHPAMGYLENPPLIGWLGYLSSLLGGSFFWIKFWPSLFGAFTLIVTANIAKELGGKLFAQVIAASGIILTAYLRTHFLFQPNFLDIFFWTWSAYYLIKYINTQKNAYLYLLSVALALGWWSKYSALFFITAIILSILLTQHRKLFQQKHFWFALLSGIVLIAPNIFWQYQHHFPLVHHMNELRDTQLKYINRLDFIKEQILMLLPVTFVWIGGLIWLLRHHTYRIIAFIYFTVIILLMLGSGKGYYALGAYPMVLAAGSVWLERLTVQKPILRYAFAGVILLLSIPFIPVLLPVQAPAAMARFNTTFKIGKTGILKWEDQQQHPLQQDFADMLGWKELTQKTERVFQSLPDSAKAATIILCGSYGRAGAITYYAKDSAFRSKVFSDNGTFLLWIPLPLTFKNIVAVRRNMPEKDDLVFQYFDKVSVVDSVSNPLSRQYGDKIIFFGEARDSAAILANNKLQKMKVEFGQ